MAQAQFPEWLTSLGARRRELDDVDRGLPWSHTIYYPGDVTSWGMAGTVKSAPDAATELALFTVASPVYDAEADETAWVISLSAAQTLALPADSDADGVSEFVYDVLISGPSGVNPSRLMGGRFVVLGFVTELA